MSKMVTRLAERGLVIRVGERRHGRLPGGCFSAVMLTPAGEAAKREVLKLWNRIEEDLTRSVTDNERSELGVGLTFAADLLEKRLRRVR